MDAVRVVFEKWGGGAHWSYDTRLLGTDEHGTWLGTRPGTVVTRPGVEFRSTYDHLELVPDAGWMAAFYAPAAAAGVVVYVDVTTVPHRAPGVVRAVDLDLDVLRDGTGRVWVADRDEFAEHRVSLGYPPDVVAAAERTCDDVERAVRAARPPFDGATAARWFAVLAGGTEGDR